MISVEEARKLIQEHSSAIGIISVDVYQCEGYALAADILAPMDFPSFRQSAMDGYAFRFDDWKKNNLLLVTHEIQAGSIDHAEPLKHDEAVRIFTGAKVPVDADTVVMQEHVEHLNSQITITNPDLKQFSNIRPVASQTKKGDLILKQGEQVTPGAAALIAGLGMASLRVYQKPTCTILTTGKELVKAGNNLLDGQIYESNSYSLVAGLKQLHIDQIRIMTVDDDMQILQKTIQDALSNTDILLITGGVSVGDYDFVSEALTQNGVKKVFHKVKQKPGKPLYFGIKDHKIIFGLPGNPGSVLTCFYEYVIPCIRTILGFTNPHLRSFSLPLTHDIETKPGLTHFLKGKTTIQGVEVLDHQESYKMNAFAIADCLIEVNEECSELKRGDLVKVHLLNS